MGHLTGDHVDLIGIGRGDDHVGVARPRTVQNIGIGREPRHPLHVQRIRRPTHQIGVVVHYGDVVFLAGQVAGDLPANLTRAANNDFHQDILIACLT